MVIRTREQMKDKPVIVSMTVKNPVVMSEMEPYADAILTEFGVSAEAVLDVISGRSNRRGLFPCRCRLIWKPWKSRRRTVRSICGYTPMKKDTPMILPSA